MKIALFLEGMLYSERVWDQAPRVGDYVRLEGPKKGEYKVVEVSWHGDGSDMWVCVTLDPYKKKP